MDSSTSELEVSSLYFLNLPMSCLKYTILVETMSHKRTQLCHIKCHRLHQNFFFMFDLLYTIKLYSN
jgi:hypothetical protein